MGIEGPRKPLQEASQFFSSRENVKLRVGIGHEQEKKFQDQDKALYDRWFELVGLISDAEYREKSDSKLSGEQKQYLRSLIELAKEKEKEHENSYYAHHSKWGDIYDTEGNRPQNETNDVISKLDRAIKTD